MTSWFWLAIVASMFWGFTYVVNQYLLRTLDPLAILFLSTLLVCITTGIYLVCIHQWQDIYSALRNDYKVILAMLGYTLCYFIASLLILKSINSGNASLAAIIESAYPLFTIPFAYFLLHEKQFNWGTILGTGLILAGLAVVQFTNHQS